MTVILFNMKFLDTHFDDYIQSSNKILLHPSLKKIYDCFPVNMSDLRNMLFYGPSGVGKYTQVLNRKIRLNYLINLILNILINQHIQFYSKI